MDDDDDYHNVTSLPHLVYVFTMKENASLITVYRMMKLKLSMSKFFIELRVSTFPFRAFLAIAIDMDIIHFPVLAILNLFHYIGFDQSFQPLP